MKEAAFLLLLGILWPGSGVSTDSAKRLGFTCAHMPHGSSEAERVNCYREIAIEGLGSAVVQVLGRNEGELLMVSELSGGTRVRAAIERLVGCPEAKVSAGRDPRECNGVSIGSLHVKASACGNSVVVYKPDEWGVKAREVACQLQPMYTK